MKNKLLLNYLKAATSRNPRKNTTRFNGFLALFVMMMGMGVSWGQLLQWNTFGNTGTETSEPSTSNDSNILAATLNYTGSTVVPAANGNRFGGSNWGTTSISTDKYIQFTVTPNSGFSFTPTSFVFIWDRSNTGPQNVTLRSSIDNYTADIGTLTGLAGSTSTFRTISISGITNITTATTFRFYGYNATGGTGGFDCASSQNNVVLNGTTVSVSPEINIKESTTSYTSGSTFAFGNQVSGTISSATTFTLENTGNATLNLSGSPIVAISGNTSEFTVDQTSTASTVAASGTTSFTVTFNPTSTGAKTAAISIANDDATGSENPYVINLTGTGTVNSSSASDIITQSGYSYTSNIDYASKQTASTLTIANSVGVNGLTLRDGGATSDSDALGTTLTDITFSTGGSTAIRTAALFDGINKIAEVAVNGATSIVFTGLSLSATDGGTKDFELRVTYQSTVTDNQQITFTVSSATASATTSNFATANAGAAASSVTGDDNRLEVIASALAFVAQPVNTLVSAGMTNVTVSANDALANRDLDFTSSIRITSSGSLTGTPVDVSASSGLATFTSLTHTASGSSLTLNAERTSALDWDVTSSAFDITVQAPGLLLLEDNFTHSEILTSNGYTALSGTGTNNLTAGATGLSYSNYGSSNIGNALVVANTGQDISRTFTQQNSPTSIYASFLVNVSAARTGDYFFAFTPSSGSSNFRARTFIKVSSNAGFFNFGISNSGTVNYNSTPTDYPINTTHLVVVKYTFTSNTTATATVFVNPSTGSEPSIGEVSFTDNTGANVPADITSFAIRQGSSSSAPTMVIDGIRIATNWGALLGNPQYTDNTTIAAGNYNSITTYDGSSPSISGNVNVYNQLSILGGTLTTNNTLTLKSDANGTARVSEVGSGGAITGNVTVERYLPARRAWRLLTAPLKGSSNNSIYANWQGVNNEGVLLWHPNGNGTNGLSVGPQANIWSYSNGWNGNDVSNTNTSLLFSTRNNAYLVYATGPSNSNNIASNTGASITTLRPKGELITGTVNYTGLTADQFHLLGNPYASPIDLARLRTSNASYTFYLLDPSLGDANSRGGYYTYNGSWAPNIPSNELIQSGQGFFVKSASATTFDVLESHKDSGNSNIWFDRTSADTSVDKIRVLLYKQNNSAWYLADGILAVNSASGNHGVDAADADKMTNFNENLFFKNGTSNLAIEYRGLPAAGTLQPLQLTGTSAQGYELRIHTENYSNSNLTPYLENTQTGAITAIPTDGTALVVPFTGIAATSTAPDSRFRIVYQGPLSADDMNSLVVGVYPNPVQEGLFTIELTNTNAPASYSLTNLLGQEVQKGTLMSLTNAIPVQDLSEGVYLLQINQEGKRFTTKLMIK